jgi:hypothetical protein
VFQEKASNDMQYHCCTRQALLWCWHVIPTKISPHVTGVVHCQPAPTWIMLMNA